MEQRTARLRRAIEKAPRTGGRRRYPPRLRAAVVKYAGQARDVGHSLVATSRALGLPLTTLCVWLGDTAQGERARAAGEGGRRGGDATAPQFRPVVFRSVPAESAPCGVSAGVIVAPGGYRIEGLSLAELVSVVKELSC